jgi:hypothetical protein
MGTALRSPSIAFIYKTIRARSLVMKRQRVSVWTGGQPQVSKECQRRAEALPVLQAPTPLLRAALIEYSWGDQKFQILATACSVRTTPWGSEQMTWLHCKAMTTAETKPEESTGLMSVLIPAHYVTDIKPGTTFRVVRSGQSDDLGVFPPNQPTPRNVLPLAEVERVVTELLTPERN